MAHRQQQYNQVDDENPFDDGPMHVPAPVRQQAPRPKQPRAVAPSAGQPLPPAQPRAVAAAVAVPAQHRAPAAHTQPRAPPAHHAAVATAPMATVAAVPATTSGGATASIASKLNNFKMPANPFGAKVATPAEPLDEAALREANLKAREAKMLAKEQEIEAREREVKAAGLQIKNWPFRRCALYHHNISEEIPPELQPMVKKFYVTCIATWIGLLWNLITVFVYWGQSDSDQGTILCLMWFVLGVPGSWTMWYHRVYKAAKNSSSRQYLCSFAGFFFHLCMMLITGMGVPSSGAGGLLVMLKAFSGGYTLSGVFALIDTALLMLNFLFSIYLLKQSRDAWQNGGGSQQLKKDRARLKMAGKAGLGQV